MADRRRRGSHGIRLQTDGIRHGGQGAVHAVVDGARDGQKRSKATLQRGREDGGAGRKSSGRQLHSKKLLETEVRAAMMGVQLALQHRDQSDCAMVLQGPRLRGISLDRTDAGNSVRQMLLLCTLGIGSWFSYGIKPKLKQGCRFVILAKFAQEIQKGNLKEIQQACLSPAILRNKQKGGIEQVVLPPTPLA